MSTPKHDPWPLPRLLKADRNAATVYLALRVLASGRPQVNTTRRRIRDVCGLHERRVTAAVRALADAGWLTLRYGRSGKRTWYRLTLLDVLALWVRKRPSGNYATPLALRARKRPSARATKVYENDPQRAARCGYENDPHPLEGIGRAPSPRPPFPCRGSVGNSPPVPSDARAEQEGAWNDQTRATQEAEKEPLNVPF